MICLLSLVKRNACWAFCQALGGLVAFSCDPWGLPFFLCHWLWEWEAYCGPAEATHWILKHERFTQAQDWTPQICVSKIPANYVLLTSALWCDLGKRERGPPALPWPPLLILSHTEKVLQGLENTITSLIWEPRNSCSILSDNSWDLIRSEKWNELWLWIRISTLIPDKNHQTAAEGFILFQVTPLLAAQKPNCSQQRRLPCFTPGSSLRASLMGSQHGKGLSHYHLRGILKDSKSPPLAPLLGFFFFFIVHGLSIITCCRINIIHLSSKC